MQRKLLNNPKPNRKQKKLILLNSLKEFFLPNLLKIKNYNNSPLKRGNKNKFNMLDKFKDYGNINLNNIVFRNKYKIKRETKRKWISFGKQT